MKKLDIIRKLANRNPGELISVLVNRPGKLRKAHKGLNIRKRSRFALQLASYGRRAPVRAAVEGAKRESPELPNWVSHTEEIGNGLRFWVGHNGKTYLAMPRFGSQAEAEWLQDGEKVDKAEVLPFLLASENRKVQDKAETEAKGQALFNAITLENIESIS